MILLRITLCHSRSNPHTHMAQSKTTKRAMVDGTATGPSAVQREGTHELVHCPLVVAAIVGTRHVERTAKEKGRQATTTTTTPHLS